VYNIIFIIYTGMHTYLVFIKILYYIITNIIILFIMYAYYAYYMTIY